MTLGVQSMEPSANELQTSRETAFQRFRSAAAVMCSARNTAQEHDRLAHAATTNEEADEQRGMAAQSWADWGGANQEFLDATGDYMIAVDKLQRLGMQ